jgi:hypothetical protein
LNDRSILDFGNRFAEALTAGPEYLHPVLRQIGSEPAGLQPDSFDLLSAFLYMNAKSRLMDALGGDY